MLIGEFLTPLDTVESYASLLVVSCEYFNDDKLSCVKCHGSECIMQSNVPLCSATSEKLKKMEHT